ncbi:hypothetical protein C9F11_42475 [Streptomyces sp. YIM 121038]|uniref:hypothetical protein n=1 Tax=Streptomyces sp. YIM 121038 TaxID=2136401 RepID=UPI0011101BEA|nr:hypothetical protein [Streptomyces sp. YIM 121038]QCX73744.1 hypothetical protein C9F11_00205 [Streptomyces sp. YIM 121038]QCX82075.1 hypothetical protein C9F11_42475 [Streptomyces sp. YIM 121038]
MRALNRIGRATLAIGAAAALVTGLSTSNAQAATGTFFYTRADNGHETTLNVPTPNGTCIAVSGGARDAHNDTDTDATMYTNSTCTVFAGFVGSRNFETFSSPFPTFVKFG